MPRHRLTIEIRASDYDWTRMMRHPVAPRPGHSGRATQSFLFHPHPRLRPRPLPQAGEVTSSFSLPISQAG
jgi:hypothetical protein